VLGASALCYGEPNAISNAVDYAKFRSRSHDAVVRVYDAAGNVIETHEQGRFQRVVNSLFLWRGGVSSLIKDALRQHRAAKSHKRYDESFFPSETFSSSF
jgi:hypothetical protein